MWYCTSYTPTSPSYTQGWAKQTVVFCGDDSLSQNHNHYKATVYMFRGAGERNQRYALLMMAIKPETALYRAPTFSLLLASHGGISSLIYNHYTTAKAIA